MSAQKFLIRGGHLVDPAQKLDEPMDLLIEAGRVAQRGKRLDTNGAEVLEAKGKVVVPGFIDLHAHFRTPGQEHKETLLTGSLAAIRGGFTTVCTMANTDPVVDSPNVVQYLLTENAKVGLVNLRPFAAVTVGLRGETLTEMGQLQGAGAAGFSDDGLPVASAGMMRRALEYSRMTGLPVIDHCEDVTLSGHGVVHEGLTAVRLGLTGIPAEAETVLIARDLLLAEATGGRLHLAHVSTAQGVELIRQAKRRSVAVTAEVTPHHLTLTEEALATYEARFKMNPPLRAKKDLEALRDGLRDGTIDAVATDHAPHAQVEKEADLTKAPFGVVGLETALAVLLTELVHRKVMPLAGVIAALTCGPARVLGMDREGTLAPGSAADVTLFDLNQEWTLEAASLASKGRNSPFLGWRLKGRVTDVLAQGRIVYRDGEFLYPRGVG